MNHLLRISLLGLLDPEARAADPSPPMPSQPPPPAKPMESEGGTSLALEMQRRTGRTLDTVQVQVVGRDHRHYPPALKFNVIGSTVYVRAEDAPALQAAILRRRQASQSEALPDFHENKNRSGDGP